MFSDRCAAQVDPEVSELEERFWNDIQKYKALLTQTRDSLWRCDNALMTRSAHDLKGG